MGGDINNVFTNPPLPQSIRPPQTRPVSDFINKAQPILMFSFVQNVEQPSGTSPPDGFASRPFLLNEPALAGHNASPGSMAMVRHTTHPPTPVSAVA